MFLVLVTLLILIVFIFYKKRFTYWKVRKVPNLPPKIPFGNSPPLFFSKQTFPQILKQTYDHYKNLGEKHCGLFAFFRPIYLPLDLDLIKNILSKDFQHFTTRGAFYNEKSDPISAHLVNLDGNPWRNLRTKLTPTFTSGKMKMMFPIFVECANNMIEALSKMVRDNQPIDVKDTMGCYTTDVIGSCAFGLDCDSFKNPNSEFRVYGKRALTPSLRGTVIRIFVTLFFDFAKTIGVRQVHPEISKFFMNIVKETIDHREKNQIKRNDFLQILLDLKEKDGGITFNQISANSFVFFLAGFDTSATTMNFALYELARNEEIQDKCRREILTVLGENENKLTYDNLKDIKYLDQIIDETLRLYAPAPLTARSCTKEYKIPGTETVLEEGVRVLIPIYLIHTDERYYKNPTEFNPDRFSPENKPKIPQYAFIPFGEGPRICIGSRFGLLQTKIGLTLLLQNFKFKLSEKTTLPLVFNPRSVILTTMEPIYLEAEKIS